MVVVVVMAVVMAVLSSDGDGDGDGERDGDDNIVITTEFFFHREKVVGALGSGLELMHFSTSWDHHYLK